MAAARRRVLAERRTKQEAAANQKLEDALHVRVTSYKTPLVPSLCAELLREFVRQCLFARGQIPCSFRDLVATARQQRAEAEEEGPRRGSGEQPARKRRRRRVNPGAKRVAKFVDAASTLIDGLGAIFGSDDDEAEFPLASDAAAVARSDSAGGGLPAAAVDCAATAASSNAAAAAPTPRLERIVVAVVLGSTAGNPRELHVVEVECARGGGAAAPTAQRVTDCKRKLVRTLISTGGAAFFSPETPISRLHVVVRAPRRCAPRLVAAGFNPQPRFRWKAPRAVVTKSRGRARATQMHICSRATGSAIKECAAACRSSLELSEHAARIAAECAPQADAKVVGDGADGAAGGGCDGGDGGDDALVWFKSTHRLKGIASL